MRRLVMLGAAAVLVAAAGQDSFGRVADALAAGNRSAKARVAAAEVLIASGARPIEGGDDLARAWRGAGSRAAYRDRVLGPVYRRIALRSGGSATFEQTFFAGQMARVAVVAVERTPFDLSVTDDDGAHQCAERRPRCDWTPIATTRFRIALENRATTTASFYVVMQ